MEVIKNIHTSRTKTRKEEYTMLLTVKQFKNIFITAFILFAILAFATPTTTVAVEKKLTASQWYEQGNQFLNSKHYDEAVAAYTETVNLNPKNADAYNRRGLIYKMRGQYELAIADFSKTIELVPTNSNVYYNKGDSYFLNKQYELAVADFSKAIELTPEFSLAYIRRGLSYYDIVTQAYFKSTERNVPLTDIMTEAQRLSYYDLIIADLSKAIEIKPDFIYPYTVRGNAYSDKGQYDLALADFDKVIELDKTYAQAYYFKGLMFDGLKKKQKAVDNYKKFLQYARPDDISIDMVKKSIKKLEQELN